MPQIPIIMPQLGESIAEATLVRLVFALGDNVDIDTDILEVETNKAVMGVTAPCAGKLKEITAIIGESYPVGATLGFLEISEEDAERMGLNDAPPPPIEKLTHLKKDFPKKSTSWKSTVEPTVRGLPVPAYAGGASFLSPRMKARMTELGLHAADLAGVAGSGANGRVTIDDLEKFLEDLERNKMTPASSMRVAVADAMRRSWTRPLATVVLPIQLDTLLAHRKQQSAKAGPALYVLRALAIALAENSAIAGRLIGARIIHPRSIDIGFAVEAEDGVLVPVIRNADQFCLTDLVERYNRLVELARARRLHGTDTGGSIATITNYGVFGLTMATPIPLPEQTLLIGMGAGQITPCWNQEKGCFLPVTEAQFTLSFDHRVLDGGAAGRLLLRVKSLLNTPEEL
ncbi:MAG: dihydrolipoamide acetyltransferase [Verrucomicrobia bacterium RIFCSPHIGHO2_12_FULL_41_10]|nr:MAG: dihydrolipoamide acetyltransferase [Verrucomicrobia bacterium RIFCSPHIGHO2_12_FULL_41_10]HLB32643.1 dihydrolipoamide acetyltransferase family protein [Chthoniobacterales bacterium]